ncbi:MAG: peptidoglycan bridge formation glycyltransferase FemA/FemB family protein [Flavobacteriaceae bacterium]
MGYTILKNIKSISPDEWRYVSTLNYFNFFQGLTFLEFIERQGYKTLFVAIKRNDKIVAMVSAVIYKEKGIKSFFSKRAIIYGGPVYHDDIKQEDIEVLLTSLVASIGNKAIYLEIRNFNDYDRFKKIYELHKFKYQAHLNFHLDCSDENEIKKNISKSKLRYIKKSLKNGAMITEANSEADIAQFYNALENLYRLKVKTPLPEIDFFMQLYRNNVAKFILVTYNDKVIGGTVLANLNNDIVYEWYVCGRDRKYKDIHPSILATWGAINYANSIGATRFDFMGAGSPDKEYGVREFKSKFGGELVEHGRFIHIINPLLFTLGKMAVSMLKSKTPVVRLSN